MTAQTVTETKGLMNVKIDGYSVEIDVLHRNHWPVRSEDTGFVVGEIIEHITATLDLPEPPVVRWSWRLDDAEAERLGKHWVPERGSTARYTTYDEALETFIGIHRLALHSTQRTAELLARKGATSCRR